MSAASAAPGDRPAPARPSVIDDESHIRAAFWRPRTPPAQRRRAIALSVMAERPDWPDFTPAAWPSDLALIRQWREETSR